MKTESNNGKSSMESNYKLIEFLISQADITASEDKGTLRYENSNYFLMYTLSENDSEYEFMIEGEYVELTDAEQDLIYTAIDKEIENERVNARYDHYEEPYFYLTH